jgi:hypothetical protein
MERYGSYHSGECPNGFDVEAPNLFDKPVSFYIQLFEGQATS